MILLSEVAEKIHNEIQSWPSDMRDGFRVRFSPSASDVRDGDERTLTEILLIPIGQLASAAGRVDVSITGSDTEIRIEITTPNAVSVFEPDWNSLKRKAPAWMPRVKAVSNGVVLYLALPRIRENSPFDLEAISRETGLNTQEVQTVLKKCLIQGRTSLSIFQSEESDRITRFRAAHSLKGAGMTLRAPELTAAARAMEKTRRNHPDFAENLRHLEGVWSRIEAWFRKEEI